MITYPISFDLNARVCNIYCKIDPESNTCSVGFTNLHYGTITAIKFKAYGYNSFGDPILVDGNDHFPLIIQDIHVDKDAQFQNYEVALPDRRIRELKIHEWQVRYEDGSIYSYECSNVVRYDLQEYESGDISDDLRAARKEYYKVDFRYKPLFMEYGWVCGCGRFNLIEDEKCVECGSNKKDVRRLLDSDTNSRLEEYYVRRKEELRLINEKNTSRKMAKRKTLERLFLAVVLIASTVVMFNYLVRNKEEKASQEAFLNDMAAGLGARVEYNYSNFNENMNDEEFAAFYRKIVNFELEKISKYSEELVGSERFNELVQNYILACKMQFYSKVNYEEKYAEDLWVLGRTIRSNILLELQKKGKLKLTSDEIDIYSEAADSSIDIYSHDCIIESLSNLMHSKFSFNGEHPIFVYDPIKNTYSYSVTDPNISRGDYVFKYPNIDHADADVEVAKFANQIKGMLKSADFNPSIVCNILSSDGFQLFHYTDGKLADMYKPASSTGGIPVSDGTYGSSSTYSGNSFSSYSTKDRSTDAWVCAISYVKDNLKSPSTAKFCKSTEANIMRVGEDEYIIHGYVDAENSFGANVRQVWTVSLFLTDRGFRDPYLEWG